ncbi:hypothetical protein [uncultured Microscilla sp.]|uniref:hypothetical protein n=1 Tax=uncultured Microscilla sp. TaxID=432653 RepID=UPI00262EE079|nr:hypothetical protein [uncultured Microscilla sp.]
MKSLENFQAQALVTSQAQAIKGGTYPDYIQAMQTQLAGIQSDIDTLMSSGLSSPSDMLQLQSLMNQYSQQNSALNNMIKTYNDSLKNIAQNMS